LRLVLAQTNNAVRYRGDVLLFQFRLHLRPHFGRCVVIEFHLRLLLRKLLSRVELDDFAARFRRFVDCLKHAELVESPSLAADGEAVDLEFVRNTGRVDGRERGEKEDGDGQEQFH
jgi:hypothetical protein